METVLYEYNNLNLSYLGSGLVFLVVGAAFLMVAIQLHRKGIRYRDGGPNLFRALGFIIGPLCLIGYLFTAYTMIAEHNDLKNKLASNDVSVVEGYVENFEPELSDGHGVESFEINGVYFEYSDGHVMNGYTTPAYMGGVITGNGQYLKIKYVNSEYNRVGIENVILYISEIQPPK